ncbi:hypothetical protein V5O48_016513, partial [Marasmius crinis-equi]
MPIVSPVDPAANSSDLESELNALKLTSLPDNPDVPATTVITLFTEAPVRHIAFSRRQLEERLRTVPL